MATFKDWLRDEMRLREVTQEKLAEEIGVSQTTVSQWLSGRNGPKPKSLARIAKYFGVDYAIFAGMIEYVPGPSGSENEIDRLPPKVRKIVAQVIDLEPELLDMISDQIKYVLKPHYRKIKDAGKE
jgi:transcriptional regulator with XRE-family HTH domain